MYLTRAQRVALKRIYDRGETCSTCYQQIESGSDYDRRSYLAFRRTVEGLTGPTMNTFSGGGQGCVMVPCGRIWFGVETDGYTHS